MRIHQVMIIKPNNKATTIYISLVHFPVYPLALETMSHALNKTIITKQELYKCHFFPLFDLSLGSNFFFPANTTNSCFVVMQFWHIG